MPRVGLHHDRAHLAHAVAGHPERPERVAATLERLRTTGLDRRLTAIPARIAGDDDLLLVHEAALIDTVERAAATGGAWLDADTAVTPDSVVAARRAAGGALAAVDLVLDGALDSAFCIDRPPGHHATPSRAMGFCLFNHVAVAARHAVRRRGAERVAVIDFDVHHGNGTQEIFWSDGAVLYCSTHEYPFYPGTGHWRDSGAGAGAGTTVNLSLPAGSADADYLAAFDRVIAPAVRRFRPGLLLVSAGYDAHLADPLADMALTAAGYEGIACRLTALAAELCAGRQVYVLEGGYRTEALARSVELTLRALLGDAPQEPPPSGAPRADVARLLDAAAALHGLA